MDPSESWLEHFLNVLKDDRLDQELKCILRTTTQSIYNKMPKLQMLDEYDDLCSIEVPSMIPFAFFKVLEIHGLPLWVEFLQALRLNNNLNYRSFLDDSQLDALVTIFADVSVLELSGEDCVNLSYVVGSDYKLLVLAFPDLFPPGYLNKFAQHTLPHHNALEAINDLGNFAKAQRRRVSLSEVKRKLPNNKQVQSWTIRRNLKFPTVPSQTSELNSVHPKTSSGNTNSSPTTNYMQLPIVELFSALSSQERVHIYKSDILEFCAHHQYKTLQQIHDMFLEPEIQAENKSFMNILIMFGLSMAPALELSKLVHRLMSATS